MDLTDEQKQQLVELYKRAEQSGDQASMDSVREALSGGQPAALKYGDPGAGPTPAEMMEPASPFKPGEAAVTPDILSGVREGMARRVDGLRQAGASLRDFFGTLVKGEAYYSPQVGAYLPTSDRVQITQEAIARKEQAAQQAQQQGINPDIREGAADITEAAPGAVAGAIGPLSRAETLTGAMIKNAGLAAGEAALQFDAENDSMDDILGASIGSGIVAGTTGLAAAGANVVKRGVQESLTNPRMVNALASARDALGNFPVTLAQRTGIPLVRTLERSSYNGPLQEFYAKQTDDIVSRIATRLDRQAVAPGQLESSFNGARATIQSDLNNLRNVRERAWNNGLARVQAQGANELFPTPELTAAIADVRRSATNPLINLTRDKLSARVLGSLRVVERQGVMSVGQTAALLQGLTGLSKATDPTARALARTLRRALDNDMNTAAAAAPSTTVPNPLVPAGQQPGAGRALTELLSVRRQYADDSARILTLQKGATYQMLGADLKAGEIPPPETLVDNFASLKPSQQTQVRQWMEQNDPNVLEDLRHELINRAMTKADAVTPSSRSGYDLGKLEEALFDTANGSVPRNAQLFTPQERRTMYGVRDTLRVLKNMNEGTGMAGTPFKAEDIAINAASRSLPFVSRQIARALTGAYGHQFLTDERVYLSLLRYSNTRGAAQDAARVALTQYLQDEYLPKDDGKEQQ